jgi:Bacterial protein of unknown function (DUF885)
LKLFAVLLLLLSTHGFARADSLAELSDSFWQWRAVEQPFTGDDIPRIDRPAGLVVDWSPATVATRMQQADAFEKRWKALAPAAQTPVHDQVDYRLLGSAIARVHWELVIEQSWKRNPIFYIDQSFGSVYALLLQPPPFSASRQEEILARLKQIPVTLQAAQKNLTDMRQPFVKLAVEGLDHIPERSQAMAAALVPQLTPANGEALKGELPTAVAALTEYRAWLETKLPTARKDTAIGRDNYVYFLHNVALMPYTPEQLQAMSQQEWSRSVAFESYQQARLAGLPAVVCQRRSADRSGESGGGKGPRVSHGPANPHRSGVA